MKLYRWKSTLMAGYAPGYLVAMAETIDEARAKIEAEWKPLEEGPTEDCHLTLLRDIDDQEELEEAMADRLNTLRNDLAEEPEVIDSGVLFFRGSD